MNRALGHVVITMFEEAAHDLGALEGWRMKHLRHISCSLSWIRIETIQQTPIDCLSNSAGF